MINLSSKSLAELYTRALTVLDDPQADGYNLNQIKTPKT